MNFDVKDIGKDYKDFVLISVDSLEDMKSKGVYLRHKYTGFEIYHIINHDAENLFSFSFRTLAKNSKGTAHIMEHSTLCGSQKFPLKEPFSAIANQSVNTFINAMTSPEQTLYPAASLVKADYYNLMDVYADAVFFPKLTEEAFMQEGWRIELDENNKASIQGVVYNEMKANYTTFNQIAQDKFQSSIYPDSYMDYDSGGDPLEIPTLTYEEFLDFHKKFYKPSNCILVLYGNIPTKEQIDFLYEILFNRLFEKFGKLEKVDLISKTPILTEEIKNLIKINRIKESKELVLYAPDNGANDCIVGLSWYSGRKDIEQLFIYEVLAGIDSAPLIHRLIDSKLGDDEALISGPYSYVINDTLMTFGLSGVKKENKDKVYKLIMDSLKEIYENGLDQKDIDAAIMGIDFNLREEKRFWSPRSVNYASKIVRAWCMGEKPSLMLSPIREFEELKKKIRDNPDFLSSLIKKYFLDQEVIIKFIVIPSKTYSLEREKKEKALLESLTKNLDFTQLRKKLDLLHKFQQKEESEEDLSCLPYLKVSEIQTEINHIKAEYQEIKVADNKTYPLILSKEDTNGIVYFTLSFPIDNLPPHKLKLLPFFLYTFSSLGWNGKAWNLCVQEGAALFGNFSKGIRNSSLIEAPAVYKNVENYPNKKILGRIWLNFSIKFIADKTNECFDLFSEIMSLVNFEDLEHFESLFQEKKSEIKENLIHMASTFMSKRASIGKNKYFRMNEILNGFTQYMYFNKLTKRDLPSLLKEFKELYKQIKDQGGILELITDEESLPSIMKKIPDFLSKIDLKEIQEAQGYPLEDYDKCIYYPKKYNKSIPQEVLLADTQVNYSILSANCSPFCSKEAAAEELVCIYLSGHQLLDKIRMTGGAYGGSANIDSLEGLFEMKSWRDPSPFKSLDVYLESLQELMDKQFSKEDVERTILTSYAEFITPDSPYGRGTRACNRFLRGNSWELMENFKNILFEVTPQDMHDAVVRLYNFAKDSKKVVFCHKKMDSYGNILKIPL